MPGAEPSGAAAPSHRGVVRRARFGGRLGPQDTSTHLSPALSRPPEPGESNDASRPASAPASPRPHPTRNGRAARSRDDPANKRTGHRPDGGGSIKIQTPPDLGRSTEMRAAFIPCGSGSIRMDRSQSTSVDRSLSTTARMRAPFSFLLLRPAARASQHRITSKPRRGTRDCHCDPSPASPSTFVEMKGSTAASSADAGRRPEHTRRTALQFLEVPT